MVDRDEEYISGLLQGAAELSDADYPIFNFLKICNEDGYNILHAAVLCKSLRIIELILDGYNNRMLYVCCLCSLSRCL